MIFVSQLIAFASSLFSLFVTLLTVLVHLGDCLNRRAYVDQLGRDRRFLILLGSTLVFAIVHASVVQF